MNLYYISRKGAEIASAFDDLAGLRIAVFREFPYLYEGSADYEKDYLNIYASSEQALLFAVYDGPVMVGATTCIPLTDETPEVQAPFLGNGYRLPDIFYFGESLLLPAYRGKGLGHRFFDEREAHARSFGSFTHTAFCAVERPDDHPLKPSGYRPNDAFWLKRGYEKKEALQTDFEWPDVGETESTAKKMTFWLRGL